MSCFNWFESEGEKTFRLALEQEVSYLAIPQTDADAAKKKHERIELGKKFLQSICELKKLTHSCTHKFYDEFLSYAANLLQHDERDNYDILFGHFQEFEKNIAFGSYRSTGGWNVIRNSLSFTASLGFAGGGMYLAIWAIASLAAGPWGVVAIGAALALVGLVFAAYKAYSVYQNYRLAADSQFDEIHAFVHAFEYPEVISSDTPTINS